MSDPQLQEVQQRIKIPLFNIDQVRSYHKNSPTQVGRGSYQLYYNCYPQVSKHPVTGETSYAIVKRPAPQWTANVSGALTHDTNSFCMQIISITKLNDINVAAFFDATANKIEIIQYRKTANTAVLIGQISGATNMDEVYLSEVELTTVRLGGISVVWIKGDKTASKMYYAQSGAGVFAAGSLTEVTDADFPPNRATPERLVGPSQQLNGIIYVMSSVGNIYNASNLYDIVNWSSSAFTSTYAYPDNGIGLFRYKHHLIAFSDTSIEFFVDGGHADPASRLDRTEQAFVKFGAISAKFIRNIDDIMYWVSSSDTDTLGVWKLDGYTPVKISTQKYDMVLGSVLGNASKYGSLEAITIGGTKNLLINQVAVTLNSTSFGTFTPDPADPYINHYSAASVKTSMLLFNIESNSWWYIADAAEEATEGAISWFVAPHFDNNSGSKRYNQLIFKTSSAGTLGLSRAVFYLQAATATDSFLDQDDLAVIYPIDVIIQLDPIEFDTEKKKFVKKMILNCDYMGGDGNSFRLYFILSKDDYVSTPVIRSIAVPHVTPFRHYINRLGSWRRMTPTIRCKSGADFRAQSIEFEVALGTA